MQEKPAAVKLSELFKRRLEGLDTGQSVPPPGEVVVGPWIIFYRYTDDGKMYLHYLRESVVPRDESA